MKKTFYMMNLFLELNMIIEFVPWAPVVFTSSVTGQNVNKLFDNCLEIKQQRDKKIKTTELNRWLKNSN